MGPKLVCIVCGATCEAPDNLRVCGDCWSQGTLVPATLTRPNMGWTRDVTTVLTANQLSRRNHAVVKMSERWAANYGPVGERFAILHYGPPGSLKSTVMCDFLHDLIIKNESTGILNCSEEGFNITTADRLERLEIHTDRFLVSNMTNLEGLARAVKDHGAAFVCLDSFQASHPNQVRSLAAFHHETGVGLLIVSHASKDSSPAGSSDLVHYVDVVVRHDRPDQGPIKAVCEKNRYGPIKSWEIDYGRNA